MKKKLALILAVVMMLTFCGCGTEPAETTTPTIIPTETTIPATMPPEPTIPTQLTYPMGPDEVCTQMPFVMGIVTEADAEVFGVQMNKLVWDVEAGTLSEPEYQYTFIYDDVFDLHVNYWNGNGGFQLFGSTEVTSTAEGVWSIDSEEYGYSMAYGNYAFIPDAQVIRAVMDDGSWVEYPLPRNNPAVIDPEYNSVNDPHYATVIGDIGIAAFIEYKDYTLPADLLYYIFNVENPDEAQWNTVEIPVKHIIDVLTNWNFAYNDGILYMASGDALLAVELETGKMTELDRTNLFAPVFQEFAAYTRSYNDRMSPFVLEGSQDGTLIAQIGFYNEQGEMTVVFVAFRENTILGVMAQHDGGVLTFYDGDMNQINSTDEYQYKFLNSRVQFARDD